MDSNRSLCCIPTNNKKKERTRGMSCLSRAPPPAAASSPLSGGEALPLARRRAAAIPAALQAPLATHDKSLPELDPPDEADCHSGRMCTRRGDGGRRHHSTGRTGDCGGTRVGSPLPGEDRFRLFAGAIQRCGGVAACAGAAGAATAGGGAALPARFVGCLNAPEGRDSLNFSRDTRRAELWLPGGAQRGEDPWSGAWTATGILAFLCLRREAGGGRDQTPSSLYHLLAQRYAWASTATSPGAELFFAWAVCGLPCLLSTRESS